MKLTTSNVLANVTPNIDSGGGSTDSPSNITNPDFSTFYVSSSSSTLIASFGSTSSINYVAVAGINIKGDGSNRTSYVQVSDGSTMIKRVYVARNHPVVLTFETRAFTNLRITLYNQTADQNPKLTYASAGIAIDVPNGGEQAGYSRSYLTRNYKNRVSLNQMAEPIAIVRSPVQAKGSLNIPNAYRAWAESTWQTFLDFAQENLFFIQEREPEEYDQVAGSFLAPFCYLCYDPMDRATAHSQTRSLVNLQLSFKVNNGL